MVLVRLILAILSKIDTEAHEQEYYAHKRKQAPFFHLYKYYNHPEDDEQRTAEQIQWRREFLVSRLILIATVCAAVAAYGAYRQTKSQAEIAQRQLDATYDEQRPWIRAEVSIVGDWSPLLSVGYELPIQVISHNIGHQLARNVVHEVRAFFPSKKDNDVIGAEKKLCDTLESSFAKNPIYGPILFPDEAKQGFYGYNDNGVFFYTKKDQDSVTTDSFGARANMYVYGCIVYRYDASKVFHRTGFIYKVANIFKNADGSRGSLFSMPIDKSVSAADIKLFELPSSSGGVD